MNLSSIVIFAIALSADNYIAGSDRLDRIAMICTMRQVEAAIYLAGDISPTLRIGPDGMIRDCRPLTLASAPRPAVGEVDRFGSTQAA